MVKPITKWAGPAQRAPDSELLPVPGVGARLGWGGDTRLGEQFQWVLTGPRGQGDRRSFHKSGGPDCCFGLLGTSEIWEPLKAGC